MVLKKELIVLFLISALILSACTYEVTQGDEDVEDATDVSEGLEDIEDMDQNDVEEDMEEILEDDESETIEEDDMEETDEVEKATVQEIPKKTVTEGDYVTIKSLFPQLKAVDPDGGKISYSYSKPFNTKGEWQTKVGNAAEYKITITASDGTNDVEKDFILVVKKSNNAPVIEGVKDITVKEGEIIQLSPEVSDADGDEVVVEISGWMTKSTYKTKFDDAGTHKVLITADDGKDVSEKEITIKVLDVNRAPIMSDLNDVTVVEGDLVEMTVTAADPDKDEVEITYDTPLDANGKWQTEEGDAGEYDVTVTASDGDLEEGQTVTITVVSANLPPVLSVAAKITVSESEKVKIDATAEDPEGEPVEITYSGWMTKSTYTTTYDDAGVYEVLVTASDGVNEVKKVVNVVVKDKDRPPVWEGWP